MDSWLEHSRSPLDNPSNHPNSKCSHFSYNYTRGPFQEVVLEGYLQHQNFKCMATEQWELADQEQYKHEDKSLNETEYSKTWWGVAFEYVQFVLKLLLWLHLRLTFNMRYLNSSIIVYCISVTACYTFASSYANTAAHLCKFGNVLQLTNYFQVNLEACGHPKTAVNKKKEWADILHHSVKRPWEKLSNETTNRAALPLCTVTKRLVNRTQTFDSSAYEHTCAS